MADEKKPEKSSEKGIKVQKEIHDVLEKHGFMIVPRLTMIGGQMEHIALIVPKPVEEKIIKPDK